jgi:biuret amidohydrolase
MIYRNGTEMEKVFALIQMKEQIPLNLEPGGTALMIVDLQRYFVQPHYPFGQLGQQLGLMEGYIQRVNGRVLPNSQRLQTAFRAQGLPIFYTAFGSEAGDGSDLPPYFQGFDQMGLMFLGRRVFPAAGEESWQIDDSLAPLPGESIISKTTASAFTHTDLEQTLREIGVKNLVIAGVLSECCVGLNARDAADRGFNVIIAEDACTGVSQDLHRDFVDSFAYVFGHKRTTAEIVQLLETAVVPA